VQAHGVQDEGHGVVSGELHAGAPIEDASEEQAHQKAGKDYQP
jgi:hypothetical protein